MLRLGAINDELSPVFERVLDLAVALGIQEIEIHSVGRKVIEKLETTEVRRVQQELAQRQLHVCNISSTVFLRCHLDDRDEEIPWRTPFRSIKGCYADHLRGLERALEIAQMLQAPLVRIFGFWQDEPLSDAIYEQVAGRLVRPLQMTRCCVRSLTNVAISGVVCIETHHVGPDGAKESAQSRVLYDPPLTTA
jgi:sugar phosphate isomerase/epimerase